MNILSKIQAARNPSPNPSPNPTCDDLACIKQLLKHIKLDKCNFDYTIENSAKEEEELKAASQVVESLDGELLIAEDNCKIARKKLDDMYKDHSDMTPNEIYIIKRDFIRAMRERSEIKNKLDDAVEIVTQIREKLNLSNNKLKELADKLTAEVEKKLDDDSIIAAGDQMSGIISGAIISSSNQNTFGIEFAEEFGEGNTKKRKGRFQLTFRFQIPT